MPRYDCCGAKLLIRDAIMDDFLTLCDSCYNSSYTNCTDCGRIIESSDAIWIIRLAGLPAAVTKR